MEGTNEIRIKLPASVLFLLSTLEGVKEMMQRMIISDAKVDLDEASWELVIKLAKEEE
mgnify:CR=1 FL=1